MRPISTDEVFRFAAHSGGVEFKTLTDGSTFRVKVEMDGVSFYPETGLGRPNSREFIDRYVALFNQEQSFVTTPYVKAKLRSSSYFVALVKAMLEYVPPEEPPADPVALGMPSDIEAQLLAFLQRSNQGGHAERNADFIAFYYGFRGHPLPTLEDTASAENLTRERARQIIEKKFREKVKPSDIPGVFHAQELLRSAAPLMADDFIESLRAENLIAAECSPAGLLRLIHEVTQDESVGIFDQNLRPTNPAHTIQQADELFFLPVEGVDAVQSLLRDAKTLPGQLGIAKLRYLAGC